MNGRVPWLPWWNKPNEPVHEAGWFHEILHPDGTPYCEAEIEAIREIAAHKTIDFTATD
jgi:hypothetical protein